MLSKEEIKRLADLARIEIADSEAANLSTEVDAVLDYVKSIQEFNPDRAELENEVREGLGVLNVMREDENPNESGVYSKELIAEFPNKNGDYLKVKKIL